MGIILRIGGWIGGCGQDRIGRVGGQVRMFGPVVEQKENGNTGVEGWNSSYHW